MPGRSCGKSFERTQRRHFPSDGIPDCAYGGTSDRPASGVEKFAHRATLGNDAPVPGDLQVHGLDQDRVSSEGGQGQQEGEKYPTSHHEHMTGLAEQPRIPTHAGGRGGADVPETGMLLVDENVALHAAGHYGRNHQHQRPPLRVPLVAERARTANVEAVPVSDFGRFDLRYAVPRRADDFDPGLGLWNAAGVAVHQHFEQRRRVSFGRMNDASPR